MLYPLIRKFFFSLDAETAHGIGMQGIDRVACLMAKPVAPCPVEVMGLKFPNPVGLAAGLDKNGDHIDGLAKLGFGFIEIGTITPRRRTATRSRACSASRKRRASSTGWASTTPASTSCCANVRAAEFPKKGGILGINIGKNATTPIENAADDYLICLKRSTTTPATSRSTSRRRTPRTCANCRRTRRSTTCCRATEGAAATTRRPHGKYVPMALKIAPDLDDEQITAIADALRRHRFDAVIATNTTLAREGVEGLPNAAETGGLSGKPVFQKSTAVQKKLAIALAGELPIIGVGGIMGGEDAAEKIRAGASLVQFYSGFIYRGPDLVVSEVAETLAHVMRKKTV
jgi:dihydroorotate dehydrogenase